MDTATAKYCIAEVKPILELESKASVANGESVEIAASSDRESRMQARIKTAAIASLMCRQFETAVM
jgi:hypothetical protein